MIVLHVMDPAELELRGPAEARFEDPETHQAVTLRPEGLGRTPIARRCTAWSRLASGLPRAAASSTIDITTDTPFGLALRRVVAQSGRSGVIAFLHPWVLLGLPRLAVPLLLHLIAASRSADGRVSRRPLSGPGLTQEHQRRLKLRHWLLLLLRTLLILALVLAAAGPSAAAAQAARARAQRAGAGSRQLALERGTGGGRHRAAHGPARRRPAILERATPADALWLLTATAIPQRRDRGRTASRLVDSLAACGIGGWTWARLSPRGRSAGDRCASRRDRRPHRPSGHGALAGRGEGAACGCEDLERTAAANIGVAPLERGATAVDRRGRHDHGDRLRAIPERRRRSRSRWSDRPGRAGSRSRGQCRAALRSRRRAAGVVDCSSVSMTRTSFGPTTSGWPLVRVAPIAAGVLGHGRPVRASGRGEVARGQRPARAGPEVTLGSLGAAASIVLPPADPAAWARSIARSNGAARLASDDVSCQRRR